jgi:peptide chain release factor 1
VALGDPSIYSDQKRFADMSREHSELSNLMKIYDELVRTRNQIQGNKELIASEMDPEIQAMAKEEI